MLIKLLKVLGLNVVELVRTKVELVSLDIQEAKIRFVSILILSAFAVFLLSLGILLGLGWVILAFWESDRIMVVGILSAGILALGLILLFTLIYKLTKGPGLFKGTLDEFERDREALQDLRRRHS